MIPDNISEAIGPNLATVCHKFDNEHANKLNKTNKSTALQKRLTLKQYFSGY